ncbi:MAG: O-acetyl-ADP-ribose deacetylase [Bacteroidota bacterium]
MNERIELIRGDITQLNVDAVVNAANSSLMGGGGVDGAIHRAAGNSLHTECMKIIETKGRCSAGEAVITGAGKMPCKFIIHTVGPIWKGGSNNEEQLLSIAYVNSLKLALENNIETIAFPNISTGVYGFPKPKAAEIAINSVINFLSLEKSILKVYFVCFDDENFQLYQNLLK